MPELPEVETVVRELKGVLIGQRVRRVEVFREDILSGVSAGDFARVLSGAEFRSVCRRGKYLLFALSEAKWMLAHLCMTGKFVWCGAGQDLGECKHHRVRFWMESGARLIFQDLRCFGKLRLGRASEDFAILENLGLEPLSGAFTVVWLGERLGKIKRSLKSFLLDQHQLVGLGNIYVCEICFRAGISPLRVVNSLNKKEIKKLHREIQQVLKEAISKNGTTISDFQRIDSQSGEFQNFLQVYGKMGCDCQVCRTPILRVRQQQRSTFYCPRCQI